MANDGFLTDIEHSKQVRAAVISRGPLPTDDDYDRAREILEQDSSWLAKSEAEWELALDRLALRLAQSTRGAAYADMAPDREELAEERAAFRAEMMGGE